MSECKAIADVTPHDTATFARLICALEEGHDGPHWDDIDKIAWNRTPRTRDDAPA